MKVSEHFHDKGSSGHVQDTGNFMVKVQSAQKYLSIPGTTWGFTGEDAQVSLCKFCPNYTTES